MISRHVPVRYSLTCALLAILFGGCASARAAPMGEPNTAAQGSANIEVSKMGYDLTNTIPYINTEVDTEATVAPTSLPMTNEDMALAEVAAVVAELTTSAAAELNVRDQGEMVQKKQISKRAEEDGQKVIASEVDNTAKALEGVTISDDDYIEINTTPITTKMSPATAQPIVPSTATEGPAILDELVRAAVAANEILAAALNVATMAVTHINTTTPATTVYAANLATTFEPQEAPNATAVADNEQVGDSEMLPEPAESYALQANEIEKLPTTTEVTNAIQDYTTTQSAVETEPTDNTSVSIEFNYDKFLAKELDNTRQSQTETPRDIHETITESIEELTEADTTDLSEIEHTTTKTSQETIASTTPENEKVLENSSSDAENVVTKITGNAATQKEQTLELTNENERDRTIQIATTESLETLIAVESEAMVPRKSVLFPEEEKLEETRTTTTIVSSDENVSQATTRSVGSQEENISTTEPLDDKTDDPSVSEQDKLVDIESTTEPPSPTSTLNSIIGESGEKQTVSRTSMRPEEATSIFVEELSTSSPGVTDKYIEEGEHSSADRHREIETSTTSIEEPITIAELTHKILSFSESSHRSTDAPSLSTITTLTTEEFQHLEASANQDNFETFPNADLTDVPPQFTTKSTEDIITTTQSTSSETTGTTATITASATEMPDIDNKIFDSRNICSAIEIREQMPTPSEDELNTTTTIAEKIVQSEDATEPEAKTVTTTAAAIQKQLFNTSTEEEHQQQQHQRALTTTNTIMTTEESTIEDSDAATSTISADITTTATSINTPEVEITTTVSTTSQEPDIITTTTTTTLSPMSLIVAEHEARSLDRTPPRVSRIVNEDGVEILTGYSIVHNMHAAVLAALVTEST